MKAKATYWVSPTIDRYGLVYVDVEVLDLRQFAGIDEHLGEAVEFAVHPEKTRRVRIHISKLYDPSEVRAMIVNFFRTKPFPEKDAPMTRQEWWTLHCLQLKELKI